MDIGTIAYPDALDGGRAGGSLIYDPSVAADINPPDDTDSFTINLDAGQTLTAVVVPAATLQPVLTITGPSGAGPATAAAAGKQVFIQTLAVSTAGTYTVTVASANSTTGSYTLQLTLNAAVEEESHDGATNNDFASAQSLDAAFAPSAARRPVPPCWAIPIAAGRPSFPGTWIPIRVGRSRAGSGPSVIQPARAGPRTEIPTRPTATPAATWSA